MSITPVSIPSPYNVLLHLLEEQVHKDSKLGIMTMWVNIVFSNINKISDACANSFGKCIMIAQCVISVFTPAPPSITKIAQSPPFEFYSKNFLAPPQFKKGGRDYVFYMRNYKGKTIKLLPFYMTDFLLQNCKVITSKEN